MNLFSFNVILVAIFVCASQALDAIDAGTIYPNLQKFENRKMLTHSFFWTRLIRDITKSPSDKNVIFLQDTRTILVLNDKNINRGSRFSLFKKPNHEISFLEIDLGREIRSLGSKFFPLATASAEYSSSSVIIEREVSHARGINFSPTISSGLSLAKTGFGIVLGLGENFAMFNKETITCTADPGGRVQLQVTNTMIHFPKARTRVVKYKRKKRHWTEEPWTTVESHLSDEKHMGALFYENFRLGRHRCVTNVTHFEDSSRRKWIEWNLPWSL